MEMTSEQKIELLRGQMLAAHTAIKALILCTPYPEAVSQAIGEALNRSHAYGQSTEMSEIFLDALLASKQTILPADEEIALGRVA